MKILLILILILPFSVTIFAQNCWQNGQTVAPVLSKEVTKIYQTKLAEAKADFAKNADAEATIWLGRRTAYLGNYRESIQIFSDGIKKFPQDARFYRHRGHRLITIRCFDDAVKDFERATKLVRGKPDEIEPDGLPNARNIPTSTLQSNIFYHVGLAYYLKGDFKRALKAYRDCEKVSTNPDMLVATKHWLYMTLRRLKRDAEANKAVADVADNLEVIENGDYYKLIKLYQGKIKAEEFAQKLGATADDLGNVSVAYGLGNWYLFNGETEKAFNIFRQINMGNQWASFGFIAAEAELRKV